MPPHTDDINEATGITASFVTHELGAEEKLSKRNSLVAVAQSSAWTSLLRLSYMSHGEDAREASYSKVVAGTPEAAHLTQTGRTVRVQNVAWEMCLGLATKAGNKRIR